MSSKTPRPIPPPLFDVLTATADDIVKALESKIITSRQVVESYLSQIEMHNGRGAKCNALMSLDQRPNLLETADRLDEERRQGNLRGPLHGVPILLKVTTALQIPLPALNVSGTHTSPAVQWSKMQDPLSMSQAFLTRPVKLIKRGLIIMGKTNMTELMGMKGVTGWSAFAGMCQPAYIPSGYKIGEKPRGETSPGGSSTGSAVAVACGFAPISVGTETSGCIVSPAAAASLYALKLTPGSVSMEGIMQLTANLDTLGTFGKTALDVALGCDALATSDQGPTLASFVSSMKLEDVSVGFVDIETWRLPTRTRNHDPKYLEQTAREYQQAKEMLRQSGVKVVDVYVSPPNTYGMDGMDVVELIDRAIISQGKNAIERFLRRLQISPVRTLEEIIRYNKKEQQFEEGYCPDQAMLETLIAESKPDQEHWERFGFCRCWGKYGIEKVVQRLGVDVVVCCSDSEFASVSVAARYPMAAIPLGYIESSGRPYGLHAIASAHQEAKLVRFMAACERVFPRRQVPDLEACAKARKEDRLFSSALVMICNALYRG